ncbi:MAG: sporulation transcriptional regulator SpoIIID [Oscillospiraceae bacterium]|nr:sporulation transcriptional regulator SpoIIID [Oscillospiraceae bacterium]MDD6528365.1 sporulation transcriptional regulator SpoIIID [Oscillospiraceae bacterium]
MNESVEKRAVMLAEYIIETNATVRTAAKRFDVSKSTVHTDVSKRLFRINPALAAKVRLVLDENKAQRHIRGGKATKEKYARLSQKG